MFKRESPATATSSAKESSNSNGVVSKVVGGVRAVGGAVVSASAAVRKRTVDVAQQFSDGRRTVVIATEILAGIIAIKGAMVLLSMAKGNASEEAPIVLKSGLFEVHFLRTGASIYRLITPDRQGVLDDIVLGHRSIGDYKVDKANTYFGCVVGRVANRIENGKFQFPSTQAESPGTGVWASPLEECQLEQNDHPHALHGGRAHWGRQQWEAEEFDDGTGPAVRFQRTSPHGEAGYPGEIHATVTYRLEPGQDKSCSLVCTMEATTNHATPVNMVQHSYFNLAGHSKVKEGALITNHALEIQGQYVTATRPDLIPTGEFLAVKGTAYDFTQPSFIGERMLTHGGGFDTNWVLHADGIVAARRMCSKPGGMMAQRKMAAEVYEPASGRGMQIETNAPGIQFYTGNFLNNNRGKDGARYKQHSGLCLETQTFPNAVNLPQFPSPLLYPNQQYRHQMVLHFFAN